MILYVLLNLATEIIDSAEIGCTITGQPHDVNILLQGLLGYPTFGGHFAFWTAP